MPEIISSFLSLISNVYNQFLSRSPPWLADALPVLLFALVIFLLGLAIWQFYKTLSQRDLLSLNLHKYNTAEDKNTNLFVGIFLYFLEYLFIIF